MKTTYGYYGTGGAYDTTGGYYGRLWEIKTVPQGGGSALMDVMHSWDAAGNLVTRQDVLTSETETFAYDFLDRLTTVSGAYVNNFTYDEIGNMLSKNGVSYSYDSTQPHAVDSVGGLSYTYDSNGNMTYRGSDNLTWDVENRPITVSENGSVIATFIYDGDGNRIKKTEAGETVIYINRFYEKNLTTGNVTTSYYLGSRLVAQREGTELRYIHQDNLSGTSLVTSDNGTMISSIKYFPFGDTRSGDVPTDVKFTGQRLDGTGLYYYGARYYDPLIGRFISADTIIPNPADPQAFNRYSYCLNNPLKYVDPTGHYTLEESMSVPGLQDVDPDKAAEIINGAEEPQSPPKPEFPIEEKEDDTSPQNSPSSPVIIESNDNDDWTIIPIAISAVLVADDLVLVVGWINDAIIPIVWGIAWVGFIIGEACTDSSIVNWDKLSEWEVDKLGEKMNQDGDDLHHAKGKGHASQRDYYQNEDGDIYVMPKNGQGTGEWTGYNIRDLY